MRSWQSTMCCSPRPKRATTFENEEDAKKMTKKKIEFRTRDMGKLMITTFLRFCALFFFVGSTFLGGSICTYLSFEFQDIICWHNTSVGFWLSPNWVCVFGGHFPELERQESGKQGNPVIAGGTRTNQYGRRGCWGTKEREREKIPPNPGIYSSLGFLGMAGK